MPGSYSGKMLVMQSCGNLCDKSRIVCMYSIPMTFFIIEPFWTGGALKIISRDCFTFNNKKSILVMAGTVFVFDSFQVIQTSKKTCE
jgi:hypothetical protein